MSMESCILYEEHEPNPNVSIQHGGCRPVYQGFISQRA